MRAETVNIFDPRTDGTASLFGRLVLRYGLASFGPVAISGAHFVAAFLFLRELARAEFGLMAFLFTVVPLCLSLSGALIGASVSRAAARTDALSDTWLATHLSVNRFYAFGAGVCVFALLLSSGGNPLVSFVLGTYCSLMCLRWFGRNVGFALESAGRVALSDCAYAVALVVGLFALRASHAVDLFNSAVVMLLASGFGLAALGSRFLVLLLKPVAGASLRAFADIWRDLARWSVLGVVLTELTVNAHAYLVTFIYGPASFALLAVGSLLMRPALLVLSALPDRERPQMARRLAAGDVRGAFRSVKEFRTAAGAVWCATFALAGAVLMWVPQLVLKHGYEPRSVLIVLALWGAITAIRAIRTPESVLLQAAGEFRALAGAGLWSSAASLLVTIILTVTLGPVASLVGILLGDTVMTLRIFRVSRRWKLAHV